MTADATGEPIGHGDAPGAPDIEAPIVSPAAPPTVVSPRVPDAWIPVAEVAPAIPSKPWWLAISVVAATVAALVLIGWGIVELYGLVGVTDRTGVEVGLRAAQAIVAQDVGKIRRLVPDATESAVGERRWRDQEGRADPPQVTFGSTEWREGIARVRMTYDGEPMQLIVEPHGQDPLAVRVTVTGKQSVDGIIRFVRQDEELRVVYWSLGSASASYRVQDVEETFGP